MNTLFPEYEMGAFRLPPWFIRYGLKNHHHLVRMARNSWKHWAQTDADGCENLSPFVMMYGEPPKEIKKIVGGHMWNRIRTATTKTNLDRMVLYTLLGWTLDEAMCWPEREKRHAMGFINSPYSKSVLLVACRHTKPGEKLLHHFQLARDIERMGGTIDPTVGRKRLRRQHDALVLKREQERSDPTPWAPPWRCRIDGYTFTLLTSALDLAVEGASQRHCCRSYADACREGREIVFKIDGPQRATVSWNTHYQSLQVKTAWNGEPNQETREAAQRCVEKYLAHQHGDGDE